MKRPIIIVLLVAAMLFVLAGIAAVVFFVANGGFPTNSPFDRNNISSQLQESKTLKIDSKKPIELNVQSAAGAVTVTGADVDTVQLKVVKTAYDSTQARAEAEVKTVKYTVEQNGNNITLKYELPDSMNFRNKVNMVDFIVTVPNEAAVSVDTGFGDVSLSGTKGNAKLKNNFGDITVQNLEGALSAKTNSGEVSAASITAGSADISLNSDFGTVSIENANGKNVTLNSNSGKITLTNVQATGNVTSKTSFGDTEFENGSANSLSVETNSGAVTLTKVKVKQAIKVQDQFGDIELQQSMAASYDLNTNSGMITVDGAAGKLKAHTDFGSIKIQNAQDVTLDLLTKSGSVEFIGSLGAGPHLVQSDFGGIELTLPTDSKLNVDLSTKFGKIKSDLPVTMTVSGTSESDGDQIIGSINGGGEQFTAQTNSGSVTVHTGK
jgi:DUF4097 and DUF4098 domain-containing protein YvlB